MKPWINLQCILLEVITKSNTQLIFLLLPK